MLIAEPPEKKLSLTLRDILRTGSLDHVDQLQQCDAGRFLITREIMLSTVQSRTPAFTTVIIGRSRPHVMIQIKLGNGRFNGRKRGR
jgi:hypothetical protein